MTDDHVYSEMHELPILELLLNFSEKAAPAGARTRDLPRSRRTRWPLCYWDSDICIQHGGLNNRATTQSTLVNTLYNPWNEPGLNQLANFLL